ncbi:uncharacterized protein LOC141588416 [Silene latifolia]|uniref:uncharacterized protein LOC141588416 n=1 Tax=Silene latifolia TaxID=37657 RepID=UPI003D77E189
MVLVKAVLSQLHSYWARIFIIPKTIILKIKSICRNYLWEGTDAYSKSPSVAWEAVCNAKDKGGLGIIHSEDWNVAMIGKYTWWLACKEDHLWIKWINHVYMKQQDWDVYQPTINSSWTWRQICKVKERMKAGYVNDIWGTNKGVYTPTAGYKWLRGDTPKVDWHPVIWGRLNTPKHSFIAWLYVLRRLATNDRLGHHGMQVDGDCELCGLEYETHEHLFFGCKYSSRCLELVSSWLGCSIPDQQVIQWCLQLKVKSMIKKQVIHSAVVALIYLIWMERNRCRIEQSVQHPVRVFQQVQYHVRLRLKSKQGISMSTAAQDWCRQVQGLS